MDMIGADIRAKFDRGKKLTRADNARLLSLIKYYAGAEDRNIKFTRSLTDEVVFAKDALARVLRLVESYQADSTRYLSPREVSEDVKASIEGRMDIMPMTDEQCDGLVSSAKLEKNMLDDARKRDERNDRAVAYITRQRDAGKAVDYWVVNDILESGLK